MKQKYHCFIDFFLFRNCYFFNLSNKADYGISVVRQRTIIGTLWTAPVTSYSFRWRIFFEELKESKGDIENAVCQLFAST